MTHIALIVLAALLGVSVGLNIFQWYRWHSYRSRPAGGHSHTAMMSKITQKEIERDRQRRKGTS